MGTLRIVAGELRGRTIQIPPGSRVRPTPDRVREALFDILGHDLSGMIVLDAFAGSGALGLEALSRGAASATFIEADRQVLAQVRSNAERLGMEPRCRFLGGRAEALIGAGAAGGPFDLVLADPPYAEALGLPILAALCSVPSTLRPGARVVLERDGRSPAVAGTHGLPLVRTARYGRTCLDFYALETPPERGAGPRDPGDDRG
jgi:16S rRNA (guanine(966)-N(2))-methyltransferase RsmD